VFKENNGCASGTRLIQSEDFVEKGITYRIVDTIGIYDTKLPPKEV
jgi:hypothetical protein